jgi:kinesin family protein 3/17
LSSNYKNIIDVDSVNGTIIVTNPNASVGEPPKIFTFDLVFGPDSKQVSTHTYLLT